MNISLTVRFWNIVSIVAVLVLAIVAIADGMIPKPVVTQSLRDFKLDSAIAEKENVKAKQELRSLQAADARYEWTGSVDQIGAQSLNTVTNLAAKYKVSLTAFRPQKSTVQDGITLMPFLILLQGSYPSVAGFIHDLESPLNKLALNSLQVASSDPSTDVVNATIGVIAYTLPPATVTTTTTTTTTSKPKTRVLNASKKI